MQHATSCVLYMVICGRQCHCALVCIQIASNQLQFKAERLISAGRRVVLVFVNATGSLVSCCADVRLVVHLNLPKSLEGFYQESGRAGRDGLPAKSVLFYDIEDRQRMEYILSASITLNNKHLMKDHALCSPIYQRALNLKKHQSKQCSSFCDSVCEASFTCSSGTQVCSDECKH